MLKYSDMQILKKLLMKMISPMMLSLIMTEGI